MKNVVRAFYHKPNYREDRALSSLQTVSASSGKSGCDGSALRGQQFITGQKYGIRILLWKG